MMINPILERELKTRMRTWKTPILLLVYLAILGFVVAMAFLAEYSSYSYGVQGFDPTVVTGIYIAISLFQLGLLMFILPVFTATSISGERERQTLDLLLCTDISPWSIIFGKMSAALSFVLLMIVAAMPFTGVILLFGGVTLFDLIKIMLFYMATAFMVSSIGMFATTHFKKNISSIVMSYIIFGATMALPVVGLIVVGIMSNAAGFYDSAFATFMEEHIYDIMLLTFASNPYYGAVDLVTSSNFAGDFMYMFSSGGGSQSTSFFRHITPWMANGIYYVIISVIALLLSKRKLTKLK